MEGGRVIKTVFLITLTTVICQLSTAVYAQFPYACGARAIGMGGAFSAVSAEISALYWNPAGLGYLQKKEISAMYDKDFIDTKNCFLGYGQPAAETGGFGFGWYRVANDFEKTDISGNSLGSGEYSGNVLTLGAGYYRGLPFSVGISLKYMDERIDSYSISGAALDAGLLYEYSSFRFAVVMQNVLNTGMRGDSTAGGESKEDIPFSGTLGIAYSGLSGIEFADKRPPAVSAAQEKEQEKEVTKGIVGISYIMGCDVTVTPGNPSKTAFSPGCEVWVNETIGFRAGYRRLRNVTAGLSFKYEIFRIDYAFVANPDLENGNIVSSSMYF
ncbi:MAG: PorV/PorQ family protein [Elusimicrobiota bacterium]